MTTTIKLENHNSTIMMVGFPDDCVGFRRCIGAAHQDPFAEPDAQTTVRLLGAGIIEMVGDNIPPGEPARLAAIAKTHAETAVMYAVKALYAADAADKSGST